MSFAALEEAGAAHRAQHPDLVEETLARQSLSDMALIQIDYEAVGTWTEENRITYTNFRNLAENPATRALTEREIAGLYAA